MRHLHGLYKLADKALHQANFQGEGGLFILWETPEETGVSMKTDDGET